MSYSFAHRLTPIVLDLNNNGMDYLAKADALNNCYFDFSGNGFATKTEWIKPTDGFLVRDTNANGVIDNVTEMFGANGGTTAYAKLKLLDVNNDNKLTGTELNTLKVWQDANSNAVTDTGELKTLSSLGITSISTTPTTAITLNGHAVAGTSTFVKNGIIQTAADVLFDVDKTNSWYVGSSINAAA